MLSVWSLGFWLGILGFEFAVWVGFRFRSGLRGLTPGCRV